MVRRFLPLLFLVLLGCPRGLLTHDESVEVLVIAPHPDDEVVMAGGVLDRAVGKGRRTAVIIVTNGDYTCGRNGWVRQAESIAALESLGVREDDVHFLGYPDGALSRLGRKPLEPMERALPQGGCEMASGTYANRGAGRRDEHSLRTGHPGEWTSAALTEDLAALLGRLRPKEVFISHAIDAHPDHAATYAYFRRALDLLEVAPAVVHRAVVHAGRCWPGDCVTNFAPELTVPALPPPHEGYVPTERLPVDAHRKFLAITKYPSQTGPSPRTDWLASFARREELFFPARYTHLEGRWVRAPVEQRFEFKLDAPISLGVDSGQRFTVTVQAGRVTLARLMPGGAQQVAVWPVTEVGPFTLEVEPRPDDGDVTEWSLRGPSGLVGLEVLAPRVTHVVLTDEQPRP